MTTQITRFEGAYAFLSNFYAAQVEWNGIMFPTSEHAYQAAKCAREVDVSNIRALPTPGQAKRAGRKIQMREGWDDMKLRVMFAILWDKFTRHLDLQQLLLETGDAILIEGNNWGDRYWGMDGTGENHLGKILMDIRTALAVPIPGLE